MSLEMGIPVDSVLHEFIIKSNNRASSKFNTYRNSNLKIFFSDLKDGMLIAEVYKCEGPPCDDKYLSLYNCFCSFIRVFICLDQNNISWVNYEVTYSN